MFSIAPKCLEARANSVAEIKLTWTALTETAGVKYCKATTNGDKPEACEVDETMTDCSITGLIAYTSYTVTLIACYKL